MFTQSQHTRLWDETTPNRGAFIVFEGIDGSGKSTQAKHLHARLLNDGYDAILTREPGGTTGALEIRRLLVENNDYNWDAMSELLLFTAARRNHVEQVIRPHLEKGGIVICDRYVGSTFAYQQAAGSGVSAANIVTITNQAITLGPDLTIHLDVTAELGLARSCARKGIESRFEDRGLKFLSSVREQYYDLYRRNLSLIKSCPALGKRLLILHTPDRIGRTEAENVHDTSMQIYRSVLGLTALTNMISLSE